MFGGEYFDNAADQIHTFNDLFRFSCSKQQWTKLVVPNGCGLCCQAWLKLFHAISRVLGRHAVAANSCPGPAHLPDLCLHEQ